MLSTTTEGIPSNQDIEFCPKHPRYFFKDGSLTLLVEGIAYRVHASILALHSPIWEAKLGDAFQNDTPEELKDVTTDELDALLSILYPVTHCPASGPLVTTVKGWTAVLRLSTLWAFSGIRALAIEHLSILAQPLEKLIISQAHNVPAWRLPAYVALCLRSEDLSLAEAETLVMRDVVAIFSARAAVLRNEISPTESVLTVFITKHVGETLSSPNEDMDAQQGPSPSPDALGPSPQKDHEITTTSFAPEEHKTLIAHLSAKEYHAALRMITSDTADDFVGLLNASSDVLSTKDTMQAFVWSIFHLCAIDFSYFMTGICVFRALFRALSSAAVGSTVTTTTLDNMLAQDIRALRETWSRYESMRTTVSDAYYSYAEHRDAIEITSNTASDAILGNEDRELEDNDNESLYRERTSNAKEFILALVRAHVLRADILTL
ncbi:hypothetical protein PENSPDRAFT_646242 [Peniophora sp. CONT]|nr:hypothetical protein PENSPDRAFT_646242 [Peniophora sp. CONT]